MKLVASTIIPENMSIDGSIEIKSASFHVIQTSQGLAEGFKIELKLSIDAKVDGFQIEQYNSKVTHTLSDEEFVGFMKHLKNKSFLADDQKQA